MSFLKNISIGKALVIIFFAGFLVTGLAIFNDYGISIDEEIQREHGMISMKHIVQIFAPSKADQIEFSDVDFGEVRDLKGYPHQNYGVVFHLLITAIEWIFDLPVHQAYALRHLMTFLTFFGAIICFYFILHDRFGSWKYPLLGSSLLVISPRIFAHNFYNLKDGLFLSFFVIATFFTFRFIKTYSWKYLFWSGFWIGIAINIRAFAILLPALLFFCLTLLLFSQKKLNLKLPQNFEINLKKPKQTLINLSKINLEPSKYNQIFLVKSIVFFIVTYFATFLFWPASWRNPLLFLFDTIVISQDYPWRGTVLYLGKLTAEVDIPWHYIPVWILVTTPFWYLVLFGLGSVISVKNLYTNFKNWKISFHSLMDFCFINIFFGSLVVTIGTGTLFYNGWRHMFYIYPSLIYLAVLGLQFGFRKISKLKNMLQRKILVSLWLGFLAIQIFVTGYWMIISHPHQMVYFNWLAGDANYNFDKEYWGTSTRTVLKYLLQKESDQEVIKLSAVPGLSGIININWKTLPPEEKKRIQIVENPAEADYYLVNYRQTPAKESELAGLENLEGLKYKKVKEFKAGRVRISNLYEILE